MLVYDMGFDCGIVQCLSEPPLCRVQTQRIYRAQVENPLFHTQEEGNHSDTLKVK